MQYKYLGKVFLITSVFATLVGCGEATDTRSHVAEQSVQPLNDRVAPDALARSLARKRCTWLMQDYSSSDACESDMGSQMLSEFSSASCVATGENFDGSAVAQCELTFEEAKELWSEGHQSIFLARILSAKYYCNGEKLCGGAEQNDDVH